MRFIKEKSLQEEVNGFQMTEKTIPYLMGAIILLVFFSIWQTAGLQIANEEIEKLKKEKQELKLHQEIKSPETGPPCAGC